MFISDGGLGDTIVAASTPVEPAARAIVRLSGPRALGILDAVFRSDGALPWRDRRWTRGRLALDDLQVPAAAVAFLAPRSYTGEDLVEVHLPGAPPLVARLIDALVAAGARPSGPGEFARRALLAGRIDPEAVEALAALHEAPDPIAARSAILRLREGLQRDVRRLRADLVEVLAEVEASLDFAEDDLDSDLAARGDLRARLAAVRDRLAGRLAGAAATDAAPDRQTVLLLGVPNAGKSSLFNALLGRSQALVSPIPGTTRDLLEAALDMPGAGDATLVDSAGISGGEGPEAHGVAQSLSAQKDATLVLVVIDRSRPMQPEGAEVLARSDSRARIVVASKADLPDALDLALPSGAIEVSARTGAGLDRLRAAVAAALAKPGSGSVGTSLDAARRAGLVRAREGLDRLVGAPRLPAEIVAIELRGCLDALADVVAPVGADEVLDHVFARFCIGK